MDADKKDELTEAVLGAAFEVANTLGCGFLEKVYERAMLRELVARKLPVKAQVMFRILYKGGPVGEYAADLVVDNQLIVELKCVDCFANEHIAQCINYLKASGLKKAVLLNFQKPRLEWKRIVYELSACICVYLRPRISGRFFDKADRATT